MQAVRTGRKGSIESEKIVAPKQNLDIGDPPHGSAEHSALEVQGKLAVFVRRRQQY